MTFRNPVYPHSFPDPFVLKFRGEYWSYCTGFQSDGRVFGVIHSLDLVNWESVGSAMDPLPGGFTCYWAPEVTYEEDGSFLMYYSVGNEERMTIHVARATNPAGPFVDTGHALTCEEFAIDAHVFKDDDGSRYLFYATDFLEHTHIGTGTVCDKMIDPYTLAGHPQPVTRARYDWQVYDPKRANKGGVRWHTVEGPFVLKRKNRYFEMFSGGNWQNVSYGVSFAESSTVLSEDEWSQYADGEKVLPILRTIPEKVIGPGHNSVVLGPDHRQLYIVYHLWHEGERVLAIDKMEIVGNRMIVLGPTTGENSSPIAPRLLSVWDDSIKSGIETRLESGDHHNVNLGSRSSLLEFWCLLEEDAALRLVLDDRWGRAFSISLIAGDNIKPNVWVRVRLDIDGNWFKLQIGDWIKNEEGLMPAQTNSVRFEARGGTVHLSPLEVTRGFEDLMDGYEGTNDLNERNWNNLYYGWELTGRTELVYRHSEDSARSIANDREDRDGFRGRNIISKRLRDLEDFELVVNFKVLNEGDAASNEASVHLGEVEEGITVALQVNGGTGSLAILQRGELVQNFTPSEVIDPFQYQQIRITCVGRTASIMLNAIHVTELDFEREPKLLLGLGAKGFAAFDYVRVTEIVAG